ncbi:MAG: VapC toxin family PIN domain ribonuclease, partial [Rhizobiales bacterium]|nr:VapC toxin family PIN domain ribonuclease [Hyphomicrobiales bacterium]
MIILDTNVISEFLRAAPSVQVEEWLAAQDSATIYLTVVSEAELRLGVAVLPEGRRRSQ